MNYGDTFFIKPKGRIFDSHLWVVISNPNMYSLIKLVVSLTTWDRDKDQSCILTPGYHPFIRHQTCVSYRDAKTITVAFYQQNLGLQLIIPSAPVGDDMMDKIIRGTAVSQFIPLGCREILIRQELI
ncbi:MAG: hypothetical protein M0Z50_02530 [Planctomycetia bacterium]|nr:hypothetical protein [Planctomycetia bacterium]